MVAFQGVDALHLVGSQFEVEDVVILGDVRGIAGAGNGDGAALQMPADDAIKLNNIFLMTPLTLSKLILPCADGGYDTTVDEQVGTGDEAGMLAQKEDSRLGYLVARSRALCGRGVDHALVALTVGIELVVSQRGDDDARRDGVDTGTALAPRGGAARWACKWFIRLVTTAPAATTAFSPMVTPGRMMAPTPIQALRPMWTGLQRSTMRLPKS